MLRKNRFSLYKDYCGEMDWFGFGQQNSFILVFS